jgi:hypothetical protein
LAKIAPSKLQLIPLRVIIGIQFTLLNLPTEFQEAFSAGLDGPKAECPPKGE